MTKITTFEDLAGFIDKKFDEAIKHSDKRFDEAQKNTNQKFAEATKHADDNLAKAIKHADGQIEDLATMIQKQFISVHSEISEMKGDIKDLKQGQEEINLRMSNVAYRFETHDLGKRVGALESKNG